MFNRHLFYEILYLLQKALIIVTVAGLFCLGFWWLVLPHGWTDLGNVLAFAGVILLFLGTSLPTGVSMTSEKNRRSGQLTHHNTHHNLYKNSGPKEIGLINKGSERTRSMGFLGVTQVVTAGLVLVILAVATYVVPA